MFGRLVDHGRPSALRIEGWLIRANRPVLVREFLSAALLVSLLAGAGIAIVVATLALLAGYVWWGALVLAVTIGSIIGALAYVIQTTIPYLQAEERASNIDDHLAFALEYMSNIVGPGAPFLAAVERITSPEIYGQLAYEMQLLLRDVRLLGIDRTTALAHAIERAPSADLKETLQGISTTMAAGGDLAAYLKRKAAELFDKQQVRYGRSLEKISILAEMFVVIAVAVPLLLLIMLVAVALFGQSGPEVVRPGFQLFSVLVPVLYAAFIAAITIYKPAT